MITYDQNLRRGYTIVELMVTIVIVACLTAVVGHFFVKLLRIQENEREEAYVREKLVEICGNYADALSVGAAFSYTNSFTGLPVVKYRLEAGGVSLETGTVTRVAYLASALTNGIVDVNVYGYEQDRLANKLERTSNGTALLMPLVSTLVRCTLTPLNNVEWKAENDPLLAGFQTADTSLGNLQVAATYQVEDENGDPIEKTVTVERVVRLWNRE